MKFKKKSITGRKFKNVLKKNTAAMFLYQNQYNTWASVLIPKRYFYQNLMILQTKRQKESSGTSLLSRTNQSECFLLWLKFSLGTKTNWLNKLQERCWLRLNETNDSFWFETEKLNFIDWIRPRLCSWCYHSVVLSGKRFRMFYAFERLVLSVDVSFQFWMKLDLLL